MTEVLTSPFEDFIVLNSGEKIYPQELEDFYTKVAPVKEMCVFTSLRYARCQEIKSPLGHYSAQS